MSSMVLSSVGSSLGTTLLPEGINLLGMNIAGDALGQAIGASLGAVIDQALFGSNVANHEGPRLSDLSVQASTEGAAIPRLYGRARLGGQLIWATNFLEHKNSQDTGGKGGGGSVTSYSYSTSFAVGLCEGEVARIGRVWADGEEWDLADTTYRFYRGTSDQSPDPLIEAKEGMGNVPSYNGLSYIVFEDLPLKEFGNRIPQLNFEVFRPLSSLEEQVTAVTIIPGATEYGYDTQVQRQVFFDGVTTAENAHSSEAGSDWTVSLNQLQDTCVNCTRAALIVSWFGDNLAAKHCTVRPKVENHLKLMTPDPWGVAGVTQGEAMQVSTLHGHPAYGGTPSDSAVKRAIQDMKERGLDVMFYPFVLMDIPPDNILLNPYGGGAGQPAHPWRGRITLSMAPGEAGSSDGSAEAESEVEAFFGSSVPGDSEWSYRRMVLHYANLCAQAGGVESFLLGSELKGLTRVRGVGGSYPAVAALETLAADVRAILGPDTKISYAADWSEYGAYAPPGTSGTLDFPLDSLWAHADINFIGIDNYMPLSDWRDGSTHLDGDDGWDGPHQKEYLQHNMTAGEGFEWYYASPSDRESQTRTPITDGAYDKPWVWRFKDLRSWWGNAHVPRVDGVELASATNWVPESKQIYFTELGFPAVDKGTNQPNSFIDGKSSESALPYFSDGRRDDFLQRQALQAVLSYWDRSLNPMPDSANPLSSINGAPMVAHDRIYLWTWDARPYPAFPQLTDVWSDGVNWQLGHWLNGRLGAAPLADLVREILADVGFYHFDAAQLLGQVEGYIINRTISPRAAIEPLMLSHFFSVAESEGVLNFQHLNKAVGSELHWQGFSVPAQETGSAYTITRKQETELPKTAKMTFMDADGGYRQAVVEGRKAHVTSNHTATADLPIILRAAEAQSTVDKWIQNAWVEREAVVFRAPPSALHLGVGDVVELNLEGRSGTFRITKITDELDRQVEATATELSVFSEVAARERAYTLPMPIIYGPADLIFLDLPLIQGTEVPHQPHVALYADPWPGSVSLLRSGSGEHFTLDQMLTSLSIMGRLESALAIGPESRWDRANKVSVTLSSGVLESVSTLSLLEGHNRCAIQSVTGEWEVVQFRDAELVAANQFELSMLLRGQFGSEKAMHDGHPIGSRFVLLEGSMAQAGVTLAERELELNWLYGPTNKAISDDTYLTQHMTPHAVGLKPLSPVHVKGQRLASGDVEITWVRRSRMDADNWSSLSVPVGEEFEMYEVEVMSGAEVIRVLSAGHPAIIYTAIDQVADFGSPVAELTLRIYQLSQTVGAGTKREAILHV